MDSGKPDKKMCRKKRRQPRRLEEEYRSRQRDKRWLETHIWHAKRMRMVTKWGYRIAEHCNDKGVRAAYRYLRHGCLISVSSSLIIYYLLHFLIICTLLGYFLLLLPRAERK